MCCKGCQVLIGYVSPTLGHLFVPHLQYNVYISLDSNKLYNRLHLILRNRKKMLFSIESAVYYHCFYLTN